MESSLAIIHYFPKLTAKYKEPIRTPGIKISVLLLFASPTLKHGFIFAMARLRCEAICMQRLKRKARLGVHDA